MRKKLLLSSIFNICSPLINLHLKFHSCECTVEKQKECNSKDGFKQHCVPNPLCMFVGHCRVAAALVGNHVPVETSGENVLDATNVQHFNLCMER